MPRDYKKAQQERDKKKRSKDTRMTKSSKTVTSNKALASGTKSSRKKTHLEKINERAVQNRTRSGFIYGLRPNNQGVVRRTEHYEGSAGTVAHGPKRIKTLKPKQASPIKNRDIPLPKSKF